MNSFIHSRLDFQISRGDRDWDRDLFNRNPPRQKGKTLRHIIIIRVAVVIDIWPQWISYNWAVQLSAICRWYNDRNWTLYWLLCKTSFDVVQTGRSLEYYSRCLHTQRQDGFMYISFDRSFVPAQLIISEVVSAILFAMLKLPVSCFLNFQTLKCCQVMFDLLCG